MLLLRSKEKKKKKKISTRRVLPRQNPTPKRINPRNIPLNIVKVGRGSPGKAAPGGEVPRPAESAAELVETPTYAA